MGATREGLKRYAEMKAAIMSDAVTTAKETFRDAATMKILADRENVERTYQLLAQAFVKAAIRSGQVDDLLELTNAHAKTLAKRM